MQRQAKRRPRCRLGLGRLTPHYAPGDDCEVLREVQRNHHRIMFARENHPAADVVIFR